MARVITFSRYFPAYHPKAGKPTYFVEQIYNSFNVEALGQEFIAPFDDEIRQLNRHLPYAIVDEFMKSLRSRVDFMDKKYHTARSGHRWKVGDKFSPRVWSGKPYNSKQIILAPDIEVKSVFDLQLQYISRPFVTYKNDRGFEESYPEGTRILMAKNDGFTDDKDFDCWLLGGKPMCNEVFEGQIICWNETINYPKK